MELSYVFSFNFRMDTQAVRSKPASRPSRSMTQKKDWPKGNVTIDFSDFKKWAFINYNNI